MAFPLKRVLISSVLLGGFIVFADCYAVSPGGSSSILTVQHLAQAIVALFGFFAFMKAFIEFLRKRTGDIAFIIAKKKGFGQRWCFSGNTRINKFLMWGTLCAVGLVSAEIGSRIRMRAFESLAERSAPLVAAIKAYEQEHGNPPVSIEELVPEFLSAIPQTGMGAYPNYEYAYTCTIRRGYFDAWGLGIPVPRGFLRPDEFFYRPLENYPAHQWPNRVERVRNWFYLHSS